MKNVDELTSNLMDETLKEAADSFFSKRKQVEDEQELIHAELCKLKEQANRIDTLLSRLNYVLVRGRARHAFWAELGLDSLGNYEPVWEHDVVLPRSWTYKGRFIHLVRSLYTQISEKIEDYTHGKYVDDPEVKGKKRLTVNLNTVKARIQDLNESIRELNVNHNPGEVLAFVRKLDVEGSRHKEIAGGGLVYNYDQELSYCELDASSLEIKEYPELSRDKDTMSRVEQICRQIYRDYKAEVRGMLAEMQQG